ncbi:MAG: SDR family oxidoreductase [Dehalococcoidia bacterium]|nr:SDR family oxidoreductase [Dehalococcoidia bacterium]
MVTHKRAVVTGGAGFIGSHLANELVRRGYHVTILDDLSTGKRENIAALLDSTDSSKADFIRGSIADLYLLQEVFAGADFIFHQAALPSVPRSVKNPLVSHEVNLTGTLNVLLAARDNGIKKVVYASSSSVYGDTPTLPKREDMPPNPQSPYAVSKVAGEYYCQVFQEIYGLSTACLRYFNVYGPGQDPNSQYAAVIPRFVASISQGKSPAIFGDGEQSRDFTFVRDVVGANIMAAETETSGVFNIGKGERTSINQLAEIIIGFAGNNVVPTHEEPRAGDVKHSLADISRARTFGYNPRYSLKEGLRETINSLQRIAE